MYKVGKEELRERLKGMPPYLMEKFKNGLANHNLTLEYIIESGFRYIGGKNNKDSFSQYEINQKKLVRVLQKLKEKYEKDKEEIHDNQEAHLFEDDTEDLKAQLDILKQQYDEEKRQMKELLSSSRFLNYFKKLYPNEPRLRCPNDCEGCGWEGIKNHRWISNGKRDDDGNLIHLVLGSKCIERFFPENLRRQVCALCRKPWKGKSNNCAKCKKIDKILQSKLKKYKKKNLQYKKKIAEAANVREEIKSYGYNPLYCWDFAELYEMLIFCSIFDKIKKMDPNDIKKYKYPNIKKYLIEQEDKIFDESKKKMLRAIKKKFRKAECRKNDAAFRKKQEEERKAKIAEAREKENERIKKLLLLLDVSCEDDSD